MHKVHTKLNMPPKQQMGPHRQQMGPLQAGLPCLEAEL